ncbi:hypothetical protein EG327_003826 [Venturia inaequalis]|uniref:CCHC-type domain-containing protein n=1 Tax=Venturia inaequalis TaxID=5025 RepID=A0A8H3VIE8_VENIN|nr:hypothetical protein EG327_003826 [Venturia inaequalis]
MCLACEGVVWHRDAQSPAPSYKFTDGIDESPGFRIPNWTGQSLGHRVLPGQSDVAPDDLTPQDPVNDVSGIVIDVTASSSLAALPMEWRGESFRQPNPTTVYPSPAAKGGGTESYERENLSLGELKDIQAARDFVVGNARKNIEEGCWNCGRRGHHDTNCKETYHGWRLEKEIDDLERKRDEDIGK